MKDEKTRTAGEREDMEHDDPEIRRLLRLWESPAVTSELNARVRESFRRQTAAATYWRRLFAISIPVPLPVAALVLIMLLLSATFALRNQSKATQDVSPLVEARLTAQSSAPDMKNDAPVVTRTSLAGFEPVTDMNVAVVPEISMR
ncbi:MAG: hypothetical protein JXO72_08420 [Vicinamibacteria bacterium]|nr:hypothetical protein [Vicinamibacteria bacterium]